MPKNEMFLGGTKSVCMNLCQNITNMEKPISLLCPFNKLIDHSRWKGNKND